MSLVKLLIKETVLSTVSWTTDVNVSALSCVWQKIVICSCCSRYGLLRTRSMTAKSICLCFDSFSDWNLQALCTAKLKVSFYFDAEWKILLRYDQKKAPQLVCSHCYASIHSRVHTCSRLWNAGRGRWPQRPEGLAVALVGPSVALGCHLGGGWSDLSDERNYLNPRPHPSY